MEENKKLPLTIQKQTRITLLLSLNAAAIIIVGILIVGAIISKGDMDFRVVGERSDEVNYRIDRSGLIGAESEATADLTDSQKAYITSVRVASGVDSAPVPAGELWGEDSITIYETANFDICVGGGLTDLGDMYWQTSNTSVISGFYSTARTWLGYSSDTCRYPVIAGLGTTTITAGTYDGTRRDSIEVTVVAAPKVKWEYEILSLVNQERVRNGLNKLSWGESCAEAAETRAVEIADFYSHVRPDGTMWDTACTEPNDGKRYVEGENLVAGNSAVSPETTVAAWMNSESHRANILNPKYTKLSVGFYFDTSTNYKTHWAQYFSDF